MQARQGAIGFDAPTLHIRTKTPRDGAPYAALVHERLAEDPMLVETARIVQAADIKDQLDDHPAAPGLAVDQPWVSCLSPGTIMRRQNAPVFRTTLFTPVLRKDQT